MTFSGLLYMAGQQPSGKMNLAGNGAGLLGLV